MLESKIGCKVSFSHDSDPEVTTPDYDGIIHLFEQPYDEWIPAFWYGVSEMICTPDDLEPTRKLPVEGIRINISLADGRSGIARLYRAHLRSEENVINARLAIVGLAPLNQ